MKKILIVLGFALLSFQSWATIEYRLRYNLGTDMFEVYFVSTTNYPGVANITASQATIAFDPVYNTNNIVVNSVSGGTWGVLDKVTGNTGTLNGKNVAAFSTLGAPISGGVVAGTEYQIFTFTFGGGQNCTGLFRLFVNGVDPTDPNGAGGDFTSYLEIAGVDEVSTNPDPTFKDCGAVLPIHLTNFSAIRKDNDAVLNWQVANQDANSSHFEIERGYTGSDFINIGRVDVNLNSGATATYTFNDADLLIKKSNGVVFYRLKMVDKDGKSTYSDIRNIKLSLTAFAANLYPNPAKGFSNIIIDLDNPSQVGVSVSDASGRIVHKMQFAGFKGVNQQKIDLSKLAGGTYLVKVNAGNDVQTISLIKE